MFVSIVWQVCPVTWVELMKRSRTHRRVNLHSSQFLTNILMDLRERGANTGRRVGRNIEFHSRYLTLFAQKARRYNRHDLRSFPAESTASLPAFQPPVSDLEILRSKSPEHSLVYVQHAFECRIWRDCTNAWRRAGVTQQSKCPLPAEPCPCHNGVFLILNFRVLWC